MRFIIFYILTILSCGKLSLDRKERDRPKMAPVHQPVPKPQPSAQTHSTPVTEDPVKTGEQPSTGVKTAPEVPKDIPEPPKTPATTGEGHKAEPGIVQLISGKDFSCYSDTTHKTTCFGNLAAEHDLIKNAPKEEMLKLTANMHAPMACGIKKSTGFFYCWGKATSKKQIDFLVNYEDKPILALGLGEDSACVVEKSEFCDRFKTDNIGQIKCSDKVLMVNANECVHSVMMYGDHALALGLHYVFHTFFVPITMASMVDSMRSIAILHDKGYAGLSIYHKDVTTYPRKLMYSGDVKELGITTVELLENLKDTKIATIAAGDKFLCLVKGEKISDNFLECHGDKAFPVPELKIKDMAAGPDHICVVTSDDKLRCFGSVTR